ncbi:MAG TPA: ADP-ribosylglycohydrolase family protein [Roseiflexaceae bacterium]|nr:ADP-ribosylglycohydrolase family protein [Roseiflexaceae bacterium]
MSLYDHILGGLYGQALGDAWCMAALLTPDQTWQRYGGWIDGFYLGPSDHPVHAGLPAGRITDDTEQAFALAESIIEDRGVTVEGAARAILRWYDRIGGDTCPYVGPSTRRAVQQLKRGVDPHASGAYGDTNGAAMRVSVVGLIHPGDVAGAARDAALQATPTHNTDVAMSGAAAVAGAVAMALVTGAQLDAILNAGIEAAEIGRRLGPTYMGASIAHRIRLAISIARRADDPRARLQDIYDLIGSTLAISESVPAAFGVLAMAGGDPLQTAIYAAGLAGDADTVGAMACAIAGAWRGADAFSADVCKTLREANPELDFEATARRLVDLVEPTA